MIRILCSRDLILTRPFMEINFPDKEYMQINQVRHRRIGERGTIPIPN